MFDLAQALDFDLAALLPARHAAYAPLVSDALAFFIGCLSPARLETIVASQLALDDGASPAERLVALLHHCPTLHKLGQVVAREPRLPLELRRRLQTLESMPPAAAAAEVLPAIRQELGRVRGLQIAGEALAEGSVAVVLPFLWRDGAAEPVRGVFKVLKPEVAAKLHEELEIWPALGSFMEQRCAELGLPALEYRDTLDSVRGLLLHEIRLDQEQAHLAEASVRYAGVPEVWIPRLLPLSTPHITAMERVDGIKVADAGGFPAHRRRQLAGTVVKALLAEPFWSPQPEAPFHADPHAGNLLLAADGRLAILDWSLVAHLGTAPREAVLRLMLQAMVQDEAAACRTLASLGRNRPEENALRAAVAEALQQVRQGRFPGLAWTMDLLDRVATTARMRFPEELVLFRKALLTLSGVLADLDAECPADRVLATDAAVRLAGSLTSGLPYRGGDGFDPRRIAPEVFALSLGWPAVGARYWLGYWRDWLGAP